MPNTLAYLQNVHKPIYVLLFSSLDPVSDDMSDAEVLVNFLVQLCDTNTMKTIVAETLMKRIVDVEATFTDRKLSSPSSVSLNGSRQWSFDRRDSASSFSSLFSSDSSDEVANITFLDFLMDFVAQFEFPQKIVTFLLHLLPNTEYKVHCLILMTLKNKNLPL